MMGLAPKSIHYGPNMQMQHDMHNDTHSIKAMQWSMGDTSAVDQLGFLLLPGSPRLECSKSNPLTYSLAYYRLVAQAVG